MGCGSSTAAVAPVDAVNIAHSNQAERLAGAAQIGGASVAGEALLAVGQHLPWIAPVAFLIGAVVKAAHDVHVLKGDALKYANFVRSAEAVLNEAAMAGTLGAAKDAVEQARAALEATLAHLQKLSSQSKMTAMLVASKDKDKFAELQTELQRCIELVALAASVSTNKIVAAQYEQGAKLAAKLESLGGVDAVGRDATKLAAVEKAMAASDRILMRGIESVREEVAASGKRVEEALTDQFSQVSAAADLRHEVMTKQIENLTSMLQTVLQFKTGAGAQDGATAATGGSSSASGVSDSEAAFVAAATPEAVHEVLEAMPVRGDEASRLAKVRELGLDLTDKPRLEAMMGDSDLEDLVQLASDDCDMPVAWISSMSKDHQIYLGSTAGARGDFTGAVVPREMTLCQHSIASGQDHFHSNLSMGKNDNFDTVDVPAMLQGGYLPMPDEFTTARSFEGIGQAASGADPTTTVDLGMGPGTATVGGLGNMVDSLFNQTRSTYASVPIRVDGQTVATLCVVDRKERGKSDVNWQKLETIAERAAKVIKQKGQHAPQTLTAVTRLTEDNFVAVTLEKRRNVAVLLHTSWCTNCPKVLEIWKHFAAAQPPIGGGATYDPLIFAEFDVTDSDPPDEHVCWQAKHVPSLVLAPKGGGSPIAYAGDLDPSSIGAWLSERCPEFVGPNAGVRSRSPAVLSSRRRPSRDSGVDSAVHHRPPLLVSDFDEDLAKDIAKDKVDHASVVGDHSTALVASPSARLRLASDGGSTAQTAAMPLLQAALTSTAAAGTQQLDTLRRIGPTTSASGKAFIQTAGKVLAAHAETFSSALQRISQSDDLNGIQSTLISAAMGMQRDAATQQLRLLQDLAGSSPAFDSDEFVVLLEASALRVSQVSAAHMEIALGRMKST